MTSDGPQQIHPLNLSRTFGMGLRLLRFAWRPIYGAAAIFLIPAYLIYAVGQIVVSNSMLAWITDWRDYVGSSSTADLSNLPSFAGPLTFAAGSLLLSLLIASASIYATAAMIDVIGRTYNGQPATAIQSARNAIARTVTLAGFYLVMSAASIAIVLIAGLAALLVVLWGSGASIFAAILVVVAAFAALILLMLRWSMTTQAVMLEGQPALRALGRSWRLVHGSTWRVLGYIVVLGIVVGLIGAAIGTAVSVISGQAFFDGTLDPRDPFAYFERSLAPLPLAVQSVATGLVAVLLGPIAVVVLTLLYYDLRWRRGEQLVSEQ
jgi:hypothetical protein